MARASQSRSKKSGQIAKRIPLIVYGGMDGTISTFAVVSAGYGSGLSDVTILILGIANLVADGFSMAVSSYLSAQSSRDKDPLAQAGTTFGAFVGIGNLLLIPYLLAIKLTIDHTVLFVLSGVFALVSFALIAALKSSSESSKFAREFTLVTVLGTVAASIAFLLGTVLENLLT